MNHRVVLSYLLECLFPFTGAMSIKPSLALLSQLSARTHAGHHWLHTVHHILHTVPLRSPAAARLRRLQRLLSPEIRVSWKAEYHHRNQLQKQSTGSCPVTLVKQFVLCERQGHKCWKLIKVNAAVKSTILFCWLQGIKSQALCFVLKRWKLSAKDL